MFKFKKKNLICFVAIVLLLLFLSASIHSLRQITLNSLKFPVVLLNLIRRELGGIIFYHRNFIQREKLNQEIDVLKYKLNALEETELENQRFREILAFKKSSSYKVIAANVIGRSPDNWASVIIADKGSSHGVKRGMVVSTFLGLAGRVIETTANTSKIMLINDSNLSVSAVVQRSRQEGLITGTFGNNLIMKYLPKDAEIRVSDIVITSGLTDMYPKGLLIGTVMELGDEFSGLTRYAVIKPIVDLANLEEVLIIIP